MAKKATKKTTKKKAPKRTSAAKTKTKKAPKAAATKSSKAKKKPSPKKKVTKKSVVKKSPAVQSDESVSDVEVEMDRRNMLDDDRRQIDAETEVNNEAPERRKVARRRQIDPTTCERDYSNDEIEFMHALDAYKRKAGRMFPTCSEILEVVRDLGYRRLTSEELAAIAPLQPQAESDDASADDAPDSIDEIDDSKNLFGESPEPVRPPAPAFTDLAGINTTCDFEV